jgi:hypothetical protein
MRLEDAVVTAVTELKTKGLFSAYDLTTFIRNQANSGKFDLPGLEARPNNQNIKFWINHEDVKSILNELLTNGALDTLGFTGRTFNGTYLEYHFEVNAPAVRVVVNPTQITSVPSNSVPSVSGDLDARVSAYLDSNLKRGLTTLKQIQSALKMNGVFCSDLYQSVQRLGYTVVGSNGNYSTYVVA